MKKLMPWVIGIMIAEMVVFYQMGKQDAATDLREQYPQVINFRKSVDRMDPNPGDLWITDSAYVYYYVGSAWVKVRKPQ